MNSIHPTAVIGDGVVLGDDTVVGPYAVIVGAVELGRGNWIGPHVVIGTPPEIRGTDHGLDHGIGPNTGPAPGIRIGDGNVIREFAAIHLGHDAVTVVGDDCYLMNRVYIAHDGVLGDGVTMAAGATLGGHVHVGAGANLGLGALVHQRRVIGPMAMVGMGAVVTRDVPPFALAYGNPCAVHGANRVGLARAGCADAAIDALAGDYAAGRIPAHAPAGLSPQAWQWWTSQTASRPV